MIRSNRPARASKGTPDPDITIYDADPAILSIDILCIDMMHSTPVPTETTLACKYWSVPHWFITVRLGCELDNSKSLDFVSVLGSVIL